MQKYTEKNTGKLFIYVFKCLSGNQLKLIEIVDFLEVYISVRPNLSPEYTHCIIISNPQCVALFFIVRDQRILNANEFTMVSLA
jgi:hypothetical protein